MVAAYLVNDVTAWRDWYQRLEDAARDDPTDVRALARWKAGLIAYNAFMDAVGRLPEPVDIWFQRPLSGKLVK